MSLVTRVTRRTSALCLLTALAASGGVTATAVVPLDESPSPTGASATERARVAAQAPALRVQVAMRNLDIPWDITVLPRGDWLVTERDRERILLRRPGGGVRVLASTPNHFWHSDETGLMAIAADPRVGRNGRVYTCTGFTSNGGHDVRVIVWRINDAHTGIRRVDTLLSGIQATTGQHGGCRIKFGDGAMYLGTGDAIVGTNPQNLKSLNGKVLRLNRLTGRPYPGNPFINADNRKKRFIYTYGHRNVQGLAWRPGGGPMWSVEHGPDRDDEVNRLRSGGNYGWNPVPGYNQAVPMTDFSLPGRQIGARWKSGFPTLATSGASWVRGREWGAYNGTLAVATLKTSRLLFMKFDAGGTLLWIRVPPRLNGDYGRLRSVTQAPSGALLITTSNGGGVDRVLKVTPI